MSSDETNIPKRTFDTPENIEKFKEFLKKYHLEKCTTCGSSSYGQTIDGGIETFTNHQSDGSYVPIVIKICNVCANTTLLSSFVMNFIMSKKSK